MANLRYWAHKHKVQIKEHEKAEILEAARIAFLKRIEQLVRKSQPASSMPS